MISYPLWETVCLQKHLLFHLRRQADGHLGSLLAEFLAALFLQNLRETLLINMCFLWLHWPRVFGVKFLHGLQVCNPCVAHEDLHSFLCTFLPCILVLSAQVL